MKEILDKLIITDGGLLILGAQISILLTTLAILFVLTYYKKFGWLWKEWLTTVDHKKIGIMYILSAVVMLARGGMDGLMMKIQLMLPEMEFLQSQHYNEVFSAHGVIMILFMAMPFLVGIMNIIIPLQIGARDVAYPVLNAMSFWFFFVGAMLFNIAFVIGGAPDAGWTSYMPLAGPEFETGVGSNYYAIAIQIAGIGTLMSGINFIVTILKMRAPGMTLMRMPMFTWTGLITSVIIVVAFPIFTVALALMTMDGIFGTHFFTLAGEGMPMLWANLFWLWGHPEVYIVILPAFGIFSEIFATFSRKNLFGYGAMVASIVGIAILSLVVWVHHFFTMGAGPSVNSFFSITTMAISIPTGVKIFNWLFTMYKGKIKINTAMLWALAFIPNFVVGGVTGVMLAMAAADYQYHNTHFLVAHFHYVLIAGVVFAVFAAIFYWWPKLFGYLLNEKLGKIQFWLFTIGFNVTFMPMFFLGLDGMTRRSYTYSAETGWTGMNFISTLGAFAMGAGFLVMVLNIVWSSKYGERDTTGDPWNARTLEWHTASPVQYYNFAEIPEVKGQDAFWTMKKENKGLELKKENIKEIHMPSNTGLPVILGVIFGIAGFLLIFEWVAAAVVASLGIIVVLVMRSFDYDEGYHVPVEEVEETERAWRGVK